MYPPQLRPVRGLAIFAMAALALDSLVGIGVIVIDLQRAALIDRLIADAGSVSEAEAAASDSLYALSGFLQLGVYVLAVVAFLIWLFRVRSNADLLSPGEQRRAKPWLILGWFVPIIWLWFPKQIVDDIWSASHHTAARPWPRSGLVTLWWAAWLIGNWVANITGRLLFAADDLESMAGAARFDVVSVALLLVAAPLAALVIMRISDAQDARRLEPAPQL